MGITRSQIADLLPQHFEDEFPKFIDFAHSYFTWMYRRVEDSSLPGGFSDNFLQQATLDREFSGFTTRDGDDFLTSNERIFKSTDYLGIAGRHWLKYTNFDVPSQLIDNVHSDLTRIDTIGLIRRLVDLWDLRGTKKGSEVLFRMFTGDAVTVTYPRVQLATPDDGMLLDDYNTVLRDDDYWNEYTIRIDIDGEVNHLLSLIQWVYYPHFHPAGFKIAIGGTDGVWTVDISNPYQSCDDWLAALDEEGYIPWVDREGNVISFGDRVLPESGFPSGNTWQLRTNYGKPVLVEEEPEPPPPPPPPPPYPDPEATLAKFVWGSDRDTALNYSTLDPATGDVVARGTDETNNIIVRAMTATPNHTTIVQLVDNAANQRIRWTNDLGATWTYSSDTTLHNKFDASFVIPTGGKCGMAYDPDLDRIWMMAGGYLHYSEDLGATWTELPTNSLPTADKQQIVNLRYLDGRLFATSWAGGGLRSFMSSGNHVLWLTLDDTGIGGTNDGLWYTDYVWTGQQVLVLSNAGNFVWSAKKGTGVLTQIGGKTDVGFSPGGNSDIKFKAAWNFQGDPYVAVDILGNPEVWKSITHGASWTKVADLPHSVEDNLMQLGYDHVAVVENGVALSRKDNMELMYSTDMINWSVSAVDDTFDIIGPNHDYSIGNANPDSLIVFGSGTTPGYGILSTGGGVAFSNFETYTGYTVDWSMRGVAKSLDRMKLGITNNLKYWSSTDGGVTWNESNSAFNSVIFGLSNSNGSNNVATCYDETQWVVLVGGEIWKSTDGIAWTQHTYTGFTSTEMKNVTRMQYINGTYLATMYPSTGLTSGVSTGIGLIYSTDLTNWFPVLRSDIVDSTDQKTERGYAVAFNGTTWYMCQAGLFTLDSGVLTNTGFNISANEGMGVVDGKLVYVVTLAGEHTQNPKVFSHDGVGWTFEQQLATNTANNIMVNTGMNFGENGSTLLAIRASSGGVLYTTDGGTTWQQDTNVATPGCVI